MIPLNKLYEYPTSTRALYNGERMYDVGKDKLPSVTTILAATQSQEKQASLAAWRARVGTDEADTDHGPGSNSWDFYAYYIRRLYFRSEPCGYDGCR
jgi:hypothetical protein